MKELAKHLPPGDARAKFLTDNCDMVEERSYMKRYSPNDVLEKREELVEASIELNEHQTKLSEIKKEYKALTKPLVLKQALLIKALSEKAELVKEKCYKFTDTETRTVEYYNADGDLVDSRPAYADELQTTIFQINRTGTDN